MESLFSNILIGHTPILPHYIIVLLPQNGREIPVFFSSRFQQEKDRVKNRPCNFLEIFQTFLHSFLFTTKEPVLCRAHHRNY